MRSLIAAMTVASATLIAGPALSADMPLYPPIIEVPELPPVDYGVGGSFYLRGSAGANLLKAWDVTAYDCWCDPVNYPVNTLGYGYSFGAGFGFETGTGLRFDATLDHVGNRGASITKAGFGAPYDGEYGLNLRSTIALANVYYDFALGGGGYGHGYSAAGGAFGYVGAGAGVAFNHSEIDAPAGNPIPAGDNTSFAAAGMAGVGYDFGSFTTDLGYRALYIAEITNNAATPYTFTTSNNLIHEVRGTVRYRFN